MIDDKVSQVIRGSSYSVEPQSTSHDDDRVKEGKNAFTRGNVGAFFAGVAVTLAILAVVFAFGFITEDVLNYLHIPK